MKRLLYGWLWAAGLSSLCWAVRCTAVASPSVLRAYENYVAEAEKAMSARFDAGDFSWAPALASGNPVRRNISDAALNQRIAAENGTVIHWVGAIRIRGASLAVLRSVLEDYDHYDRIYRPLVFECKAVRSGTGYDATLGLQNTYRFASVFPQRYTFQVKARIEHSTGASLRVHLGASEVRESESGVPGRTDFLERYHDHGIMWALNAWWHARQEGNDVYLEFETITLARSVEAFVCKIGFVPVPKSIIASAMDSLPEECVTVVLEGTKAECERRARR